MKQKLAVIGALLLTGEAFAGGGWVREKGSLYVKTSVSWLKTNRFYTSDGKKLTTADFRTWSLSTYAEYGISSRWTGVVHFPILKQSSFETTGWASGIGDLSLDVKYGLVSGSWPLAIGLGMDVPTGDKDARADVKNTPGAFSVLPTGDGEWNYRASAYLSHAFNRLPMYFSVDASYHLRTQGFVDDYSIGLQAGYRIFPSMWLQLLARRLAPIREPGNMPPMPRVGIGEGVQYTSIGGGLSYEWAKGFAVTLDYFTAVGKTTNIYSGANIVFGISFEK